MKAARGLASGALLLTLARCSHAPETRTRVPPKGAHPAQAGAKPSAFAVTPTLPPLEDPAPAVAACRAGDARECGHAARLYYEGWGVPRDMVRVAIYGGLACSSGIQYACPLRDLAYFSDNGYPFTPGVAAYKWYLQSLPVNGMATPGFCTQLPSHDRWGWAAYAGSSCFSAEMGGTPDHPPSTAAGEEFQKVYSACFEAGDVDACRGKVMTSDLDTEEAHKLAPMCRRKGALCDVALGDTDEETASFRATACFSRSFKACDQWWDPTKKSDQPLAQRISERLLAEICLHPENASVPFSLGEAFKRFDQYDGWCGPANFPSLTASKDEEDQALIRALAHVTEEIRGADCAGRFYDAYACYLFVFGLDKEHLGLSEHHTPEEQRWKERLEVLEHMCKDPPPFDADKKVIDNLCSNRKFILTEHKSFLAQQARKKSAP